MAVSKPLAREKIEQLVPAAMGSEGTHPYSRLLHASMPKLDPAWLDTLVLDPVLERGLAER